MKKIELLLNLENFQNITFYANEGKDRLGAYGELLPYIEDWVGYTPFALKLANHIRKILQLDPYEVVYEGLEIVQEVEIKKLPKSTQKLTAGVYSIAKNKDGTPKTCTNDNCNSYISWDDYPTRRTPIHIDEKGHIIGTGDCPEYDGGG